MSVPTLDSSARVWWHENILLSCGLFPCQHPRALIYCPCYRLPPDKLVIWALTSHEMLWLYQLPLSMDAFLADLHPDSPLPYEGLAPLGLFTSVLHQLWGVVRGGSTLEEDREVEVDEERSVEEDEVEVEEEERSVDEVELGAKMARLDPGRPFPIGSLDLLAKPWCPASTTATEVTPV